MFIHRSLPNKYFTRCDNNLITESKLSDGAFRLYMYLALLQGGANYTDSYLMKVLRLSRRAVANRKKELKDLDLLIVDQIAPRTYQAYLGFTGVPATEVRRILKEKQDKVL